MVMQIKLIIVVVVGIQSILGLQPRDKAAMLGVKTKETFWKNLHENRVLFPGERNAFVLDHQHGHRDVTCKPAIVLKECRDYLCSSIDTTLNVCVTQVVVNTSQFHLHSIQFRL